MKKKITYFRAVGSARIEGKYNGSVIIDPKHKFLPHGIGICKYKDGQVYKGKWKKGKRDGKGEFKWSIGDVYNGQWKNDKKNGKGKFTWFNGDIYIGQWKNDSPNGKGKFFFKQGFQDKNKSDTYVGQVKDYLRHGKGTYTWVKQGKKYHGSWKNNNRHGYGVYKEGDSIYRGSWKNDKRWGKGKITIKKQRSISGTFRHTNLKGEVTMDFWKPFNITSTLKFRKYIGTIHPETFQPNGQGYFLHNNKKVAIGIWKNGKIIKGKTIHKLKNKTFTAIWNNGKIIKTKDK